MPKRSEVLFSMSTEKPSAVSTQKLALTTKTLVSFLPFTKLLP